MHTPPLPHAHTRSCYTTTAFPHMRLLLHYRMATHAGLDHSHVHYTTALPVSLLTPKMFSHCWHRFYQRFGKFPTSCLLFSCPALSMNAFLEADSDIRHRYNHLSEVISLRWVKEWNQVKAAMTLRANCMQVPAKVSKEDE